MAFTTILPERPPVGEESPGDSKEFPDDLTDILPGPKEEPVRLGKTALLSGLGPEPAMPSAPILSGGRERDAGYERAEEKFYDDIPDSVAEKALKGIKKDKPIDWTMLLAPLLSAGVGAIMGGKVGALYGAASGAEGVLKGRDEERKRQETREEQRKADEVAEEVKRDKRMLTRVNALIRMMGQGDYEGAKTYLNETGWAQNNPEKFEEYRQKIEARKITADASIHVEALLQQAGKAATPREIVNASGRLKDALKNPAVSSSGKNAIQLLLAKLVENKPDAIRGLFLNAQVELKDIENPIGVDIFLARVKNNQFFTEDHLNILSAIADAKKISLKDIQRKNDFDKIASLLEVVKKIVAQGMLVTPDTLEAYGIDINVYQDLSNEGIMSMKANLRYTLQQANNERKKNNEKAQSSEDIEAEINKIFESWQEAFQKRAARLAANSVTAIVTGHVGERFKDPKTREALFMELAGDYIKGYDDGSGNLYSKEWALQLIESLVDHANNVAKATGDEPLFTIDMIMEQYPTSSLFEDLKKVGPEVQRKPPSGGVIEALNPATGRPYATGVEPEVPTELPLAEPPPDGAEKQAGGIEALNPATGRPYTTGVEPEVQREPPSGGGIAAFNPATGLPYPTAGAPLDEQQRIGKPIGKGGMFEEPIDPETGLPYTTEKEEAHQDWLKEAEDDFPNLNLQEDPVRPSPLEPLIREEVQEDVPGVDYSKMSREELLNLIKNGDQGAIDYALNKGIWKSLLESEQVAPIGQGGQLRPRMPFRSEEVPERPVDLNPLPPTDLPLDPVRLSPPEPLIRGERAQVPRPVPPTDLPLDLIRPRLEEEEIGGERAGEIEPFRRTDLPLDPVRPLQPTETFRPEGKPPLPPLRSEGKPPWDLILPRLKEPKIKGPGIEEVKTFQATRENLELVRPQDLSATAEDEKIPKEFKDNSLAKNLLVLAKKLLVNTSKVVGPLNQTEAITVEVKSLEKESSKKGPYSIIIDPNTNVAWLYAASGALVNSYPIATGDITGTRYEGRKYFSPVGTHKIIEKQERPTGVRQEGPFKFRLSYRNPETGKQSHLLHGPYDSEDDIIKEGAFINKGYLSHGCIRFRIEHMLELVKYLEVGSEVEILPYKASPADKKTMSYPWAGGKKKEAKEKKNGRSRSRPPKLAELYNL